MNHERVADVPMRTYGDVRRLSQLEEFDLYWRERAEAAVAILRPVLNQVGLEEFLRRRIDLECERRERRLSNLRQARRAMDELRERVGFEESILFDFDCGRIVRTPQAEFWKAVRGLLEEFWTGGE